MPAGVLLRTTLPVKFRCDTPGCKNNHLLGGQSWERIGEYTDEGVIRVKGGYCEECQMLGTSMVQDRFGGLTVVVER